MTLLSATKRNNFHAFERTKIDILLRALRGKKKKGEKEKLKFSTPLASPLEKINTPADSKLPLIIHRIYRRYIFVRLKIRNLYPRISILFFHPTPSRRIERNSEIVSRILGCGYSQLAENSPECKIWRIGRENRWRAEGSRRLVKGKV